MGYELTLDNDYRLNKLTFMPDWIHHLRLANEVALEALAQGHHPFGATLVGADGKTVLLRQGNVSTVRHAETELARKAAELYSPEELWLCTLVTTFEPCVMCAGTLYWANIGRVVFGLEEKVLLALTGDHEENPTLDMSCRAVYAAGQKKIEVLGPFPELTEEITDPHRQFWAR